MPKEETRKMYRFIPNSLGWAEDVQELISSGTGGSGGEITVDLSNYYTKEEVNSKVSNSLTNYVSNTDFATSTKGGVIKFSQSHGITMSADGFLMGATRTAEQYTSNSGNMLINKGTLENVLNSKSENWEFTLSNGSTVTKKIVCA